jgi:replicative DNA helicase
VRSGQKDDFVGQVVRRAIDFGVPIAIISRQSKHELMAGLMAHIADVDLRQVKSGYFPRNKWTDLTRAAAMLHDAPVYVDEASGEKMRDLCRKLTKLDRELRKKKQRLGAVLFI